MKVISVPKVIWPPEHLLTADVPHDQRAEAGDQIQDRR